MMTVELAPRIRASKTTGRGKEGPMRRIWLAFGNAGRTVAVLARGMWIAWLTGGDEDED